MPFPKIEPEQIKVFPLDQRQSKSEIKSVSINPNSKIDAGAMIDNIRETARRIRQAKETGASVILAFGAHLIKNGLAPVVIKLMEQGWVTHVAGNGACGIHDWAFAWLGRSEEDVRANVTKGKFGTWEETGKYINLAVQVGASRGMGYGESLGAFIEEEELLIPQPAELAEEIQSTLPEGDDLTAAKVELLRTIQKFNLSAGEWHIQHATKKYSLFAAAYRLHIPATIHPGIGYDIIYNNPYANGAALGRAAHTDFKVMVNSVNNLSNGVFLSVGSAIMAPQVFEKSISFANNLRLQKGEPITNGHFMVINDLQESTWDWSRGEPPKESPDYYFRFLKSFYRMGGEVRYIAGDNRAFLVNLFQELNS